MPKHGKSYLSNRARIDRSRAYPPREALELVREFSFAKFDETVELHVNMNLDPRRADQQVRGVARLPAGTGKRVRIMVFAEGEAARLAEEAGADHVGLDEYVSRIQEGWLEFDVAVAIPQVMGKIGRLGRILGPRGLMPSPKAGTIVQPQDLADTIQEFRLGRVQFRLDRGGNLHIPIGKVSFETEQLMDNWAAVMDTVLRNRPAGAKGAYIRRITLTTTMGPGVRVEVLAAQDMRAA
ncbi:MAG: 50S ribosomal protein L1 [Anaerolineales bacterium]|nr:MAG: 50S ribosomal protein L1 [Anaerolineales bacterium]